MNELKYMDAQTLEYFQRMLNVGDLPEKLVATYYRVKRAHDSLGNGGRKFDPQVLAMICEMAGVLPETEEFKPAKVRLKKANGVA
jgi:hypothetical protein